MGAAAAIQAIAGAVSEFFKFLNTPEGQTTVKTWRENDAAFRKTLTDAGAWFESLVK